MKKRGAIYLTLAVVFLAAVLLFQNCNGTRFRYADFNISRQQVLTQIEVLSQSTISSLAASSEQPFNDFFDLASQPQARIYYAEAPSSMGDLKTVLPLEYDLLNVDTFPTAAAAYLAVVNYDTGPVAALVITQINSDNTETPIIALSSLQGGTIDDYELNLPVLFDNVTLYLRSEDIIDGSLSDVVQFELVEPYDAATEFSLGLINLVEAN